MMDNTAIENNVYEIDYYRHYERVLWPIAHGELVRWMQRIVFDGSNEFDEKYMKNSIVVHVMSTR